MKNKIKEELETQDLRIHNELFTPGNYTYGQTEDIEDIVFEFQNRLLEAVIGEIEEMCIIEKEAFSPVTSTLYERIVVDYIDGDALKDRLEEAIDRDVEQGPGVKTPKCPKCGEELALCLFAGAWNCRGCIGFVRQATEEELRVRMEKLEELLTKNK